MNTDNLKTDTEFLTGKGYKPGWYVFDKRSNTVLRGPYMYMETASAVRQEMERNATERQNELWNLAAVENKVPTKAPTVFEELPVGEKFTIRFEDGAQREATKISH